MKFRVPFSSFSPTLEVNKGVRIVEDYGYITPEERIKNLILAGERVLSYRAHDYDSFKAEGADLLPVSVYKPDLTDIDNVLSLRAGRIKARREAVKAAHGVKSEVQSASNVAAEAQSEGTSAPPPRA